MHADLTSGGFWLPSKATEPKQTVGTKQWRSPAVSCRTRFFLSAGDSGEDTKRLALLQECLALFNGSHAFHNYTKRKLYRLVAANLSSINDLQLHPRPAQELFVFASKQ